MINLAEAPIYTISGTRVWADLAFKLEADNFKNFLANKYKNYNAQDVRQTFIQPVIQHLIENKWSHFSRPKHPKKESYYSALTKTLQATFDDIRKEVKKYYRNNPDSLLSNWRETEVQTLANHVTIIQKYFKKTIPRSQHISKR